MTEPLAVRPDAATAAPASPVFVALRASPGANVPGGAGVVAGLVVAGVVGGGAAGVVGVGAADEVLVVGVGLGDVGRVVGLLDGAVLDGGGDVG